ncbi:MAG: [protein-PII] uridylyltransferase [Nitrospirae bacterium GWB2_47_37]|nr:MAG: [protein-PII] uridylyltransferase [Nitrospirae bacterium GWB2_47_37]HAK88757.1 [protein-PII] uridylyltransferase [Nitrospiraceae bacterium]
MVYLKVLLMNTIKPNIANDLCAMTERLMISGADGTETARRLTQLVDDLLISAYKSAGRDKEADAGSMPALVAVGGYGRRELAPYSDIDIMLLAKKRSRVSMEAAQSILYRLWDMGLNISHCFRTLDECVEDAMKDLQTRTSLMESRFLAGNNMLFNEFRQDVYQKLLFKRKKEFIGELLREIAGRHKQYGDSVYLLEPNIKEGRGGLRDIHSVSWLLKTGLRMNAVEDLKGILSRGDYDRFMKAYDFLLRARLGLHLVSMRRNDVLSFEFQDETAKVMGFKDTKRFLGSEILMRLYYRKAKGVMDVTARLMNMCSRPYVVFRIPAVIKKITDDFYISKNEIIAKDINIFKDADRIFEAFHIYSGTGKKFSSHVREALRNRFIFINKKTRSSRTAIRHFMEILKGNRVYETLNEMHDTGILDRFIPEFGRLRHLVIQEPYHRYTVDEHTLIAVRNIEMLKNTKHKKMQHLADILKDVRQEVLFLSLLLHDIGKGAPHKRHEDSGYRMLKRIMERFNIEQEERRKIEFLVKNHIALSKLALTRDSDAYETIIQLAETVENEDNLNALYLMTYADMTAVNPVFWTEWKAYLFYEIYTKTKAHLNGAKRQHFEIPDNRIKEFVNNMPDRYLISSTIDTITADYKSAAEVKPVVSVSERQDGTAELTVIADDMPGLFSRIVGAIGFRGLNVLRARLYTGGSGLVIDKILVSNWKAVWWQGMEERIKEDVKNAILEQNQGAWNRGREITKIPLRFEGFIEIDNETSDKYTILELVSHDRLGLLYDISMQFCGYDVDIISAVINTEDNIAQDVFYLQYNNGKLNAETIINILNSMQDVISE